MKNITKVEIRNKKEFEEKVHEYRNQGFMIVTYWKCFAEMEKGSEFIIIDKK